MEVDVIVSDTNAKGEKGLFDVREMASTMTRTTIGQVSSSFREFCRAFSEGLEDDTEGLSKYRLEKIEMAVDLTLKGEVRIIASGSAESKGSVKLIFSRRE